MRNTGATVGVPRRRYLRIGPNEYPIYGGDDCGWSIDEQEFSLSGSELALVAGVHR